MQFLLTKDELDALVPKEQVQVRDEVLAVAAKAVMRAGGRACWHDTQSRGYCDDCPLVALMHEAHMSRELRVICDKQKAFSK